MKKLNKLFELAGAVGGVILFAMALLITSDVGYRFITTHTITGVYEFSEIGFLATVFCAMSVMQIRNKAIRIDIVQTKISKGRLYYALEVFNAVVSFAFFAIVIYLGVFEWMEAFEGGHTRGGIINIPLTIPYGFMIVGGILTCLSLLCTFYISVKGVISPEEAERLHNKLFDIPETKEEEA